MLKVDKFGMYYEAPDDPEDIPIEEVVVKPETEVKSKKVKTKE